MPLDPYFAAKMAVLTKFDSVEEAMADPATAKELALAFHDTETEPAPDGDVTEQTVPTREGLVPVRIYRPSPADATRSALVWVHGGGFAGGSITMPESDTVARELAFLHGILVVTVDYALSDGVTVTYPTPHRQVVDVFGWVRDHRHELGYADHRLALGGASAGANLAAAAVLELRERGQQLPDCAAARLPDAAPAAGRVGTLEPELSAALGPTRMNQKLVDHMFTVYTAGREAPLASVDGHDLSGFPRTLTVVSEYDDLRPSGERFHTDLLDASVDAHLYLAAGMPHGHLDRTRKVPEVGRTVERMADYLREP